MVFNHGAFCERRHYKAQFIDDSDISLVHYLKSLQQLSILDLPRPSASLDAQEEEQKRQNTTSNLKETVNDLAFLIFLCALCQLFHPVVSENFKESTPARA